MTSAQSSPSFPIPEGMEGFWQWDKMHCPRPQTPITEEIFLTAVSKGFSAGMDEFASPVGLQYKVVNYFGYMGVFPLPLGSESMDDRVARYQGILHDVLPRMGDLWENEWLPSILPGLEKARSTDYAALSDDQLFETLDDMITDLTHRYTVHGKINYVTVSASMYADFYVEQFSPSDPTEPYLTLQGFPTRSVDAGRGLWRLSRTIKGSPALRGAFETVETDGLISHLEGFDEGRAFLSDFRTYLDEFGWRSDVFELSDKTWREDPAIPLNTLQGYIFLDDSADPDVKYGEAVALRDKLLAQARDRLASDPEKLGQFNDMYEAARHYLPITENHNYYIDQIGNGVMRFPILEFGRRLAAKGAVAEVDDVFLLYLPEIRAGLGGTDQKALVAQRKSDIEQWSKVIPVPVIGEPPEPHGDPMEAALGKMFGMPVEPSTDPNVINGIGASPGTVQGRAKVVKNLSEASKVQPGDILVCQMTMPAWTPLFSIASAVVADTGGVLSHCAIVSREYGMPCVVGTQIGTASLQDGMMLTVDGSQGIVRIDSRV
ncbi:MAG: hypothetical protein IH862_03930 [Chloroflexi bacterium]|nr:hypothetical protein [Chloroflexota bacterium]